MRAKTPDEIKTMHEGGKRLGSVLKILGSEITPGLSGRDVSKIATDLVKKYNLHPILLGYEGFPDVICISVNDAIVHGVPTAAKFKQNDVVKLDLTVRYKTMVVDSAISVIVGAKPAQDTKRLVEGTKRALDAGIAAIKGDGTRVGDIASAVQDTLTQYKLGIVRDLVGHGVGYEIHENPNIPNYGVAGTGPALISGMTIAIEPMAMLGDWQVITAKDGWTVISKDHSLTAHFEHTVLITEDGAEILTLPEKDASL
jgi:methionyl aminopeptidase